MGTKYDISNFEHGIIVGARQGGLSSSETVDLLGFSYTIERKLKIFLLISEGRGDWFKLTGTQQLK